jgi:hypothetical protein
MTPDLDSLRSKLLDLSPTHDDPFAERMAAICPVADHEQRPWHLVLGQDRRGCGRDAKEPIVEGEGEVFRRSVADGDIGRGNEAIAEAQRQLDLIAESLRADIVDSPLFRADRVVGEDSAGR